MVKGTLKTIVGDVTNPQMTNDNELAIIPHCCNNGRKGDGIGVMGAGVAKALRNKWPLVFEVYKKMEDASRDGLKNRLGENCNAVVEDNIVVVNMIGQDGVRSETNTTPVNYWALQKCREAIRTNLIPPLGIHLNYKHLEPVIHTCKFGSDLAGGNWDFILELIREQWLEYGIDVVIYEFEG